jgi:hypothetical protein
VDVELLLRAILPPVEEEAPARGRRGRAAAPKAARAKRVTADRRATKRTRSGSSDMRAYRRMPEDLAAQYRELNSITALAQHYGVPRHTAQGWMNRLRKQGLAGE